LDYGAGFGQTSMILNSIGSDVIAYDSSAVRIAYLKECGLKVAGSPSEVEQFAPYSAVICDNVLEHVGEPKRLIESFLKNLAPNGILFISVPDCGPKQVAMLRKNPDMSVNPWEHLNYFSLKHLDEMLSSFGFEPLDQIALGERIDLGLRAEYSITRRMKNGLASGMRMIRYMVTGFTVESVSQRFYRLVASN
jgi:SAM-dependent methyltransferase